MGNIFITKLFLDPYTFFMLALIVIFSICLHEYSHARTALAFGDSTAADAGHLTLNPLKQMGPVSLIMFLFIGIAWGAVPVNETRLRSKSKWGPLFVSLAGPSANFVLAFAAWIIFGFVTVKYGLPKRDDVVLVRTLEFVLYFGMMNIILFIFNLLPVPGLDGWNAARFFFPRIGRVSSEVVKGVMMFLIFAALMSFGYITKFALLVMLYANGVIGKIFG